MLDRATKTILRLHILYSDPFILYFLCAVLVEIETILNGHRNIIPTLILYGHVLLVYACILDFFEPLGLSLSEYFASIELQLGDYHILPRVVIPDHHGSM